MAMDIMAIVIRIQATDWLTEGPFTCWKSRAKIKGETVGKIFSGIDGQDNVAYDRGNGSSNTDDEASSTTRNSGRSHGHHERIQAIHPQSNSQITWQDRHRPGLMSSDQLSSTPSSKM